MRAVEVIVVEEGWEVGGAVGGGLVGACVGPFPGQRLDEPSGARCQKARAFCPKGSAGRRWQPFGLAVGLWTVGSGEGVLEAEFAAGGGEEV